MNILPCDLLAFYISYPLSNWIKSSLGIGILMLHLLASLTGTLWYLREAVIDRLISLFMLPILTISCV